MIMSMQPAVFGPDILSSDVAEEKRGAGFFSRAFTAFIAARDAEARARVRQHLSQLSDEHLIALGLSADEVRNLRTKGSVRG